MSGQKAAWPVTRLKFGNRVRVSQGAPSTDFGSNDADVVIQWADDPMIREFRCWIFAEAAADVPEVRAVPAAG